MGGMKTIMRITTDKKAQINILVDIFGSFLPLSYLKKLLLRFLQSSGKAFSGPTPILPLNSLSTENEKSFQEGYQLLAMGSMGVIRNIFSHGDENTWSPEECFEMLLFLN